MPWVIDKAWFAAPQYPDSNRAYPGSMSCQEQKWNAHAIGQCEVKVLSYNIPFLSRPQPRMSHNCHFIFLKHSGNKMATKKIHKPNEEKD